jgi:uncharacterized protein (DUF885 family)
MTRFSHFAALGIMILAASACGAPPPPAPSAAPAAAPREQLNHLFERYWDERIPVQDVISPQALADSLDVEKRFLTELLAIPRDTLDADERLSYDIFRRQRETAMEGFTYPGELLPINPFGGMLFRFPAAAAQSADAPMSVAQYDRWLRGADDYVRWTRQAIANMQDGLLRGYTAPRTLIERALPILERLGTDAPSNVFYAPLRSLPQGVAGADRERLNGSLRDVVTRKLLPATRALHDYLQHSYLPKARVGLGLADLPLGSSWYAYLVRRAVGVGALPADIHRIGLREVERLKPRLQAMREAGAPPSGEVPSVNDVVLAYQDLGAQVAANMPTLFAAATPTPYEIRAADYILEPATPLYYRPALPGSNQNAVLYVNSHEIAAKPAVASFLQQAVPGQHYQNAIQQQRLDLPRFRRLDAEPAFVAGWALYAASLGEELGMYASDANKYQALNLQMRCAIALVLDTGLHSQGWTRAQSLEYLHAQMSIEDGDAEALIDVYAATPGDALSCGMGALKFQALRSRMQQSLGARFDIHEFHTQILKDGAMPLDILEAKMTAWMEVSR